MFIIFTETYYSVKLLSQVIAAEGEQKASRALREASEVIGDSPAALQLRYLQVKKYLRILLFQLLVNRLITIGYHTQLLIYFTCRLCSRARPIAALHLPVVVISRAS